MVNRCKRYTWKNEIIFFCVLLQDHDSWQNDRPEESLGSCQLFAVNAVSVLGY